MVEHVLKENRVVSIDMLHPHPQNYRSHPDEQVNDLVASLQRFGPTRSIVVQDGPDGYLIVAGHGLVEAAKKLQIKELRADIIPADWSPSQVKGYLVADNNLSNKSSDDETMLAELLQEQVNSGFDLASLGTDDEALRQMLEGLGDEYLGSGQEAGDGGDEFDTTPEAGPTRTHVGEIWQLGKHRMLVGDCTDSSEVQRLMDGKKADMLWTDPPYGVSYVGKTKDALTLDNDDVDATKLYHFLCTAFGSIDSILRSGAAYYIAHPDIFAYEFVGAVRHVDWRQARPPVVLWVKDSMVLGRGDYHARSEPILYGWKPGAAHHAVEDRTQDNVWEIARPKRSEDHPTMKPIELVERAINNSSNAGDLVFDGFLGSGTTLIASHRTSRVCYGCEVDPKYADVILRRFTTESGIEPELIEQLEVANVS